MTHHQPACKNTPSLARDNVRIPFALANASGDSTDKKQKNRSKSKSKVPKSVRYDLENALVSLCDVWFEEIKPYLIRNNVKVHVHGAAGEMEAAGGDRDQLSPGAPHCAHLDPGAASDRNVASYKKYNSTNEQPRQRPSASYADCFSAQRTASRAPCRRPPAPPPPQPERQAFPSTQNPCLNCQENLEPKSRRRRRRKHAGYSEPLPPPQLVARLCRTVSIPPNRPNEYCPKIMTHHSRRTSSCKNDDKLALGDRNFVASILRKPEMEDKWTQTEIVAEKQLTIEKKRMSRSRSCSRRTGALTLTRKKSKIINGPETTEVSSLFQNDLIDIIGETHDKILRVLYKSPAREEHSSVMNLIPCSTAQKLTNQKKPWR